MTRELTDDQANAAADSLAQEISQLCGGQPSEVVMTAFAALVAVGITSQPRDLAMTDEQAISAHTEYVRYFVTKQRHRGGS